MIKRPLVITLLLISFTGMPLPADMAEEPKKSWCLEQRPLLHQEYKRITAMLREKKEVDLIAFIEAIVNPQMAVAAEMRNGMVDVAIGEVVRATRLDEVQKKNVITFLHKLKTHRLSGEQKLCIGALALLAAYGLVKLGFYAAFYVLKYKAKPLDTAEAYALNTQPLPAQKAQLLSAQLVPIRPALKKMAGVYRRFTSRKTAALKPFVSKADDDGNKFEKAAAIVNRLDSLSAAAFKAAQSQAQPLVAQRLTSSFIYPGPLLAYSEKPQELLQKTKELHDAIEEELGQYGTVVSLKPADEHGLNNLLLDNTFIFAFAPQGSFDDAVVLKISNPWAYYKLHDYYVHQGAGGESQSAYRNVERVLMADRVRKLCQGSALAVPEKHLAWRRGADQKKINDGTAVVMADYADVESAQLTSPWWLMRHHNFFASLGDLEVGKLVDLVEREQMVDMHGENLAKGRDGKWYLIDTEKNYASSRPVSKTLLYNSMLLLMPGAYAKIKRALEARGHTVSFDPSVPGFRVA